MTGLTRRWLLKHAAYGAAVAGLGHKPAASAQPATDEISPSERQTMAALADGFRKEFDIPGLSVAITRNGRLVYAEGFGVADLEKNESVRRSHLFRIASLTKPITSVAVFSLIEQGRLKLADTVFGPHGILQTRYGKPPYKPFIADITIEHLLTHTCGGWQDDEHDPMRSNPLMNHQQLISWTLDNLPLADPPGTKYGYSNFGYCVLGRVIEKIARQTYADYVRSAILSRCGIAEMRIAGNTRAQRAPGEVAYYPDGDPYGMNIARMDSNGGWVASSVDLARFATHVDGLSQTRNILKPETIKIMTTPSSANPGYAKGWDIIGTTWSHRGSIPGTTATIFRTQSGFCWAALANARHDGSGAGLNRMAWNMVRAVKGWAA